MTEPLSANLQLLQIEIENRISKRTSCARRWQSDVVAKPPDRRDSGTALDVLAALASPDRLRVFGAIAATPDGLTLAAVVAAVGLDERLVQDAVGRLWQAGLLAREHGRLVARVDAIKAAVTELADSSESLDEVPVALRRLFSHGRLTAIPVNAGPRRELLEYLAGLFPVGQPLSEADVNATLGRYHDDHAALRRYLVDAGLLNRDASGATYTCAPPPAE
jgi:hypothetical protein